MERNLPVWLFIFLMFFAVHVHARHIVGGEIRMQPAAGLNQYTFTLVQFWDENNLSSGNRDSQVDLLVYRKRDNQLVAQFGVPYVSTQSVDYQNKACAAFRSLKTVEGTYSQTVTLNPLDFSDPEGYYVVWERCCRNDDINNIESPGSNGMVFYLEFPPLNVRNTSPEFSFPNGQYICKGQPFTMKMSAVDADGDELRYSLVTPMRGNTTRDNPIGNAAPKTGYPLVQWSTGITLQNVIPGTPSLRIDNASGTISVTANAIGLYVFTVQCEEFRNGRKIGLTRRDFQLLVIECNQNTPSDVVISYNRIPATRVELCPERPIVLETEASPLWSYQWQLDGQNIPGEVNPTITVKDTGSYSIVKSFKAQCSRDTTSQQVKVVPGTPPPALLSYNTDIICLGDSLNLVANTGQNLIYTWRKGTTPLGSSLSRLSVTEQGTYYVEVKNDKNGCSATDSVAIRTESISLITPKKLSVQRGNTVALPATVKSSSYPVQYNWIPLTSVMGGNDSIPLVSPPQTTTYQVQVISPAGCVVEDTIQVVVFDLMYIPDAFSPNGDGINDLLEIRNGEEQIEDIKVFNRWGEVVYQAPNYATAWNGFYNGQVVPAGSYIYRIKTSYFLYEGTILVLY
jgi:gliding motility-associated-like protein